MVKLIAKSATEGLLPVTIGDTTVMDVTPGEMTSVAPFRGQQKALSTALKENFGQALPNVGRSLGKDMARIIWFGRNQWMVLGPCAPAPLVDNAALSDQSDGWVVLRLKGALARDGLSRLTPLDVRDSQFKLGHTARTEFQHMMCSITRTGARQFDIMVMRSMAKTAVHDLKSALERAAASAALR